MRTRMLFFIWLNFCALSAGVAFWSHLGIYPWQSAYGATAGAFLMAVTISAQVIILTNKKE